MNATAQYTRALLPPNSALHTIQPSRPDLHLLLVPRPLRRGILTALTVRLALAGPLRVLDGGNGFDAYRLARELRRQTLQWRAALERLTIARAFTCYQVVALLAGTADASHPALALDLLATFYDESVPLDERRRLLGESLTHLRRLSRQAPVIASAELPPCLQGRGAGATIPQGSEGDGLLAMLLDATDQVWRFEPDEPPTAQPRLF